MKDWIDRNKFFLIVVIIVSLASFVFILRSGHSADGKFNLTNTQSLLMIFFHFIGYLCMILFFYSTLLRPDLYGYRKILFGLLFLSALFTGVLVYGGLFFGMLKYI